MGVYPWKKEDLAEEFSVFCGSPYNYSDDDTEMLKIALFRVQAVSDGAKTFGTLYAFLLKNSNFHFVCW